MAVGSLVRRIKRGWGIGLSQRDAFVWIGTIVIGTQIALIGYLMWIESTRPKVRPGLTSKMGARAPAGPAVAIGTRGWITHVTADLNPTPKYSRENRRLWSFTPVTVLERTPDGQWLRVEATMANGQKLTGWVLAQRVQTNDPTAGARPEPGWVVVTQEQGAILRAAPELNADGYGAVPRGQVMRQIARLKRGGFNQPDVKDFLLVENLGPAGRRGQAWVFEGHVAPTKAPPGSGAR